MIKIKILNKHWIIKEIDKPILPNGKPIMIDYYQRSYIPDNKYKLARTIYISKNIPIPDYLSSMSYGIQYAICMETNCNLKDAKYLYNEEYNLIMKKWLKKSCLRKFIAKNKG